MPSPVVEVQRAEARPIDADSGSGNRPGLAIRTEGLTKRLGGVDIVDRLDLSLPAGAGFGVFRPDRFGETPTPPASLRALETGPRTAPRLRPAAPHASPPAPPAHRA